MCINVIVFLQEEKETVDMCINVIVFSSGRERDYIFVLIVLFFFWRRKIL